MQTNTEQGTCFEVEFTGRVKVDLNSERLQKAIEEHGSLEEAMQEILATYLYMRLQPFPNEKQEVGEVSECFVEEIISVQED